MNVKKVILLITLMTRHHILAQATPKQYFLNFSLTNFVIGSTKSSQTESRKSNFLLSFKTLTDVSISDASLITSMQESLLGNLIDSGLSSD